MSAERLFIRLYTDEHVMLELARTLRAYGYMAESACEAQTQGWTDSEQLTYASERGMALLTYDVADFMRLAKEWHAANREHAGIILSQPFTKREFSELLRQTLRLLDRMTSDEIRNTVVVLQDFR
ncbi:MAG: DUF5615 family PIN-like protein [Anaerolineales bacterium]|nr:DUF5615 family PIN-like protein [Anaerolineales bacterium]